MWSVNFWESPRHFLDFKPISLIILRHWLLFLQCLKKRETKVLVSLLESRQLTWKYAILYSSPLNTPWLKQKSQLNVLHKTVNMINFIKVPILEYRPLCCFLKTLFDKMVNVYTALLLHIKWWSPRKGQEFELWVWHFCHGLLF